MKAGVAPPLFVIDDDPTGAQIQADVELLLGWSPEELTEAAAGGTRVVHLLTNSRALAEAEAYDVVRSAAEAVRAAFPGAEVVLRGDSTLRGHLLPEHRALCDALHDGAQPPVLLVPALPSAGRVTIGGVHWLDGEPARTPVASTAFARDSVFAYTSERLVDWAAERSHGHFAPARAQEIGLAEVRGEGGPAAIAAALHRVAASSEPGVVVPDAEAEADLEVIAEGLRLARSAGTPVVVRCGPAFVGALAGTTAHTSASLPRAGRGVLVVVGSHVATTTRQLAVLAERHGSAFVEVEPGALAGAAADASIRAAAAEAMARLAAGRLAVVATARATPRELLNLASGMRIAQGLAAILAQARSAADVVVSKGGITSAVNTAAGFGATRAHVVGPVAPGISLWQIPSAEGPRPLIVFPGNVGGDDALADLVDDLLET